MDQLVPAMWLLEVSGMKNGDVAGLAAFQKHYGYVGVKMEGGTNIWLW